MVTLWSWKSLNGYDLKGLKGHIKSFDHLEEFQGVFSVYQNASMIANIKN